MSYAAPPPPEPSLREIEQAAVAFAREAGAELERRFSTPPAVRFKSSRGRDPVTDADIAAESLIRSRVAEHFPSHSFLGEEGEGAGAEAGLKALPATTFLWVVDPLDGTANFANGVPIFAVSIGVLRSGRPVVAALYTTFGPDGRRCTLHAHRGSGLKIDGNPVERAGAAERGRLVGVPAGFERRMRRRLLRRAAPGETRSLGSIAVELGLAACGRLAFAFFGGPKIWDVAAGILLVEEAGGRVVATDRGPLATVLRLRRAPWALAQRVAWLRAGRRRRSGAGSPAAHAPAPKPVRAAGTLDRTPPCCPP